MDLVVFLYLLYMLFIFLIPCPVNEIVMFKHCTFITLSRTLCSVIQDDPLTCYLQNDEMIFMKNEHMEVVLDKLGRVFAIYKPDSKRYESLCNMMEAASSFVI